MTWKPSGDSVACTLGAVEGTLVDIDGRTAISGPRFVYSLRPDPLFVRWPDGWRVASVPGGLEVLDPTGKVEGRTGTHVAVYAATSSGSPMIVDGAMLACPYATVVGG